MYLEYYDIETELLKEVETLENEIREAHNDFENRGDVELIEHIIPSIKPDCYHYIFEIPKTVKYIKSISLQIELDGDQISIEDKNSILESEIHYNFINSKVIALLTQQICNGNSIIENENNLVIPLLHFDDCFKHCSSQLVKILFQNEPKVRLNLIIQETTKQTNPNYVPIVMNSRNDFYLNFNVRFGSLIYISDYDQPLIDNITINYYSLTNMPYCDIINYNNENILVIEIWGLHLYITTAHKEYSTTEKIINCIKNPIEIVNNCNIHNTSMIHGVILGSLNEIDYNKVRTCDLIFKSIRQN